MDNSQLYHALTTKHKMVVQRYKKLDQRSKPRVPKQLEWIVLPNGEKNGRVSLCLSNKDYIDKLYLDNMARTFVDLEKFDQWLDRSENGVKKFQVEMEKQAEDKILKLKTFAALGVDKENVRYDALKDTDAPF